jgi:threonine/homoserine/homoserine lactone efflux protein
MLLLGLTLGLSAGLSPGPLMTLVITTTLRDGLWHGLRVAAAPFLTDLPIILLSVFVLGLLPPWTLAVVGVVGGLYVVYLGWETVRSARQASAQVLQDAPDSAATSGRQSLLRGAAVNALNPHPYLFWATVGGPTLLAAFSQSMLQGALFLLGFYVTLIGSKVAVAALVHSQSRRFSVAWYQRILTLLGLLLIGLGVWLGWQAVQLAGF